MTASPVAVRAAGPHDGSGLASLALLAYARWVDVLTEPPAPLLLDYDRVAGAGATWVAEVGGTTVGMVTVETGDPGDPDLVLRNLAVLPAHQRRGIGGRLAGCVEELARASGRVGVRLWTRSEMAENVAFYTRRGYVVTHVERSAGASRVFLRKDLR